MSPHIPLSLLAPAVCGLVALASPADALAEDACPTGNGVGLYSDGSAAQPVTAGGYLQFADLDNDQEDDACSVIGSYLRCYTHRSAYSGIDDPDCGFSSTRYERTFPFNIEDNPEYGNTLSFVDLDDDDDADVCVRGTDGIWCAKSNGVNFDVPERWTASYADAWGWNQARYYDTMKFVDVDQDGRTDVCARGSAGIWCSFSDGNGFQTASLRTQSGNFSNAGSGQFGSGADQTAWGSSPSYWETIDFADIDDDGDLDVCGRGKNGVFCARFNAATKTFSPGQYWVQNQYRDDQGWAGHAYYSTIQFGDVSGDGLADVCGRGSAGVYCGYAKSLDSEFQNATTLDAAYFSNTNVGVESRYSTLVLTDTTGDDVLDICVRAYGGIYCAASRGLQSGGNQFDPVTNVWVYNFGDIFGWGASEDYWGTVQPTDVNAYEPGTEFCGMGDAGIWCSAN